MCTKAFEMPNGDGITVQLEKSENLARLSVLSLNFVLVDHTSENDLSEVEISTNSA